MVESLYVLLIVLKYLGKFLKIHQIIVYHKLFGFTSLSQNKFPAFESKAGNLSLCVENICRVEVNLLRAPGLEPLDAKLTRFDIERDLDERAVVVLCGEDGLTVGVNNESLDDRVRHLDGLEISARVELGCITANLEVLGDRQSRKFRVELQTERTELLCLREGIFKCQSVYLKILQMRTITFSVTMLFPNKFPRGTLNR